MTTPIQTCYRHGDRRAGVVCQRCDRPICPDCMRQASVGFHCPECTKQGAQKIIRPNQLFNQRPVVTQALVAINAAIFVLGLAIGLDRLNWAGGLIALAVNPFTNQVVGVADGEWWRLVSSAFLHVNLMHVGFNMFILYRLGQVLEPAIGRSRFLLCYIVSMLGGSLGVMILDPHQLTVGASGAVFGMMGLGVAVFRSRGLNVMNSGLGATIILNLVITFAVPGISIGGHIGGLITGFVAGTILTDLGPRYVRDDNVTFAIVAALGVVAAGAAILIA